MALQLVSLQTGKSNQPLRNVTSNLSLIEDNLRYVTEDLFERIRKTPELISMLDTAVTDHFLGSVDFFDLKGKPLTPEKQKQVEQFWVDSNIQFGSFAGQGLDYFVDGSSFGWIITANNLLTPKQKEFITKLKATNPDIGRFAETSSHMPRKVSYLPASTVEIIHDNTGILYYLQQAAGERVRWEKDNVVHVKLMDFNGEIRGYSALKALIKEIMIMFMLKENIWAKLQNGGSPDYIISLMNKNGISKARFERVRTALESFSHLKKSHGNMPIDAEIKVHPLGTNLKDMEYRELAMFIISEFALALGMPTSRVPFLMTGSGGSSNKGELSGNSEDAYQSKINARRTNWENSWNKVFRKAEFMFKFRRDNLQDDVRETQAATQRVAYVSGIQDSLAKSGKQLKISSQLQLISGTKTNLSVADIEDKTVMSSEKFDAPIAGPGGLMQPSNQDAKGLVTQQRSEFKQKTAFNNGTFV